MKNVYRILLTTVCVLSLVHATAQTTVQFTSASGYTTEKKTSFTLTVSITNPDGGNATTADVVLTNGSAADIGNYTTQSINFPAASSANITVPLTITDNAVVNSAKTITFELQNIAGGNSAVSGAQSTFDLIILDNEVVPSNLLLNEIHGNPASGLAGDANGDGIRSVSADEFIEFINTGSNAIDITGYKLFDTQPNPLLRHTFPATLLKPGKALVLFGGPTLVGSFGNSILQVATGGQFQATDDGDNMIVIDASGNTVIYFSFGDQGPGGDVKVAQSLVRDPDVTGGNSPMTKHSIALGSGGTLFSPGTTTDGKEFGGIIINEIMAFPSISSSSDVNQVDANGDGTLNGIDDEFIELVNASPFDMDISGWQVHDASQVRHIFPASTVVPAGGAILVFGRGTPIGAFGGSIVQVASEGTHTLNLNNGGDVLTIKDGLGNDIASYTIPDLATAGPNYKEGISLCRIPDITGTDTPLSDHPAHPSLLANGGGPAFISPGTKVDGTPFIVPATTSVQLTGSGATINEGIIGGTYTISVSIAGASLTNPTSVSLVLTSGSATDLNNYTTQLITFPAGSTANQDVVITITDDGDVETDETFIFQLQSPTGGNSAILGTTDTFTLNIQDNDFAMASVIINEFMAWPAGQESSANGPVVDSNGDGSADIAEDEFIEFVNNGNVDVDMSGWKLFDSNSQFLLRHTFPNGTVLNPGGALVVFGGGNPTGDFGGALVQLCSTGNLGMTNTSDVMVLRNQNDETVLELSYGQQTRGTSITLNPDVTGAIGPHPSLNGKNISPGTKVDGSPFAVATRTNVQFGALSGSLDETGGTIEIPITIVRENPTNPTTAEVVITTTGYEGDINYTTQLVTFPAGSAENQVISITVIDDDLLEGDELFQFQIQNVSGGTSAVAGSPSTFEFMVNDDDVPLVFNEIHADPASSIAGDANNDGIRDAAFDEFIEIVNRSLEDVDMSGWKFHDASQERHVFPQGTILQPGRALVVFGGGIPTGTFGGSEVQLATDPDGLGLTNTGDQIVIYNADNEIMAGTIYGNLADNNQSISKNPDITGGLMLHSEIPAANGKLYSPGFKNNGGLFINIVTGLEKNVEVAVHPNPATHLLTITTDGSKLDFVMFDNLARPIKQVEVTERETFIEVGTLPRGIYFYKVRHHDGVSIKIGKVVLK